jgi:hypothetical protein
MVKMPCCRMLKEHLAGIELTLQPNHLVSRNHQLIELENNCNQEVIKKQIGTDRMLYQIYRTIHSNKTINHIEV